MRRLTVESLNLKKSYLLTEFVKCFQGEPEIIELALMRILTTQDLDRNGPSPKTLRATGSELREAVKVSQKALQIMRSRPTTMRVPGLGELSMPVQIPLIVTPLFQ